MAPSVSTYDGSTKAGITLITLIALSSLLSIIYLFTIRLPAAKTFKSTHLFGYFFCLLVANVIQTVGTIIDFEWVSKGGVVEGFSCTLQGALKQTGNLAASFWSLIISIHIFLLVFFRIKSNQTTFIGIIILIWSIILFVPLLGRFVLQTPELGPYYGIAGQWCWITPNYQQERIFLECISTLFTIGVSFILYSMVILRVRGLLIKEKNSAWKLKFFGSMGNTQNTTGNINYSESQKASGMLKIAKNMVWYPISYTAVMTPMTIIRLVELKYDSVPFVWTAVSGIFFNSMGLINVILLLHIAREFNRLEILPRVDPNHTIYKITVPQTGEYPAYDDEKDELDDSKPRTVKVDIPTKPAGTYVAPDSWKTSAGNKG